MRHGKKTMHLGRKTAHRKSMLANMACSLIEHKRINTTVTKAKALKQFIEPIVTKSKTDSTQNRRLAFASLRNKYAVTELFRNVASKIGDRPGGYTRIIKLGNRLGDNASMAMIEFVDYNEVYTTNDGTKKKNTRRGRTKKAATASKQEAPQISEQEPKEDNPQLESITEETVSEAEANAEDTAPKVESKAVDADDKTAESDGKKADE